MQVTSESAERFGKWFQERRIKAGHKTKADFLRSFAIVGASALSQIEAGKLSVALDTALALGRAVGASDMETLVALGEVADIEFGDVQLLERIAKLGDRDKRVVADLVSSLLRHEV